MSEDHSTLSWFLRSIIREYQADAMIVGEDRNIGCIFFILVTKDFKRKERLHCIILSLSGAGKTTLAEAMVKPFIQFKASDVIKVTRFSGPALERMKTSLDGTILFHSQATGQEPTTIRPLLSEGELGLLITEVDDKGNYQSTVMHAEGMPVYLGTTTNPTLDQEFLRRLIERTMDESNEQTRKIKGIQAEEYKWHPPSATSFEFIRQILERICTFKPAESIESVLIPYSSKLSELIPDTVEMRSLFPKFLRLIASIAIVKSICYRGYYTVPASKSTTANVVVATQEDFRDALYCAGEYFFQPLSDASIRILEYLRVNKDLVLDEEEHSKRQPGEFTVNDLTNTDALGMAWGTIRKYVDELETKGLVQVRQVNVPRKTYYVRYVKDPIKPTMLVEDFDTTSWIATEIPGSQLKTIEAPVSPPEPPPVDL